MITKVNKILFEDGTADRARQEEAPAIRAILDDFVERVQQAYNTAATDHRYLQGGLHLLRSFQDLIKQP